MGKPAIHIDTKRFKARLKHAQDELGDMSSFWDAVGQIMRTSMMDNFEAGGRPRKWKKLSKAYAKRKKGNKTLIASGVMRNSTDYKAASSYVDFGSYGVEYAARHNFGFGTTPQRKFVVMHRHDRAEIYATLDDYLEDAFK